MSTATLESILRDMEVMVHIENNLSVFYKQCADRFPENSDFWLGLSKEESYHEKVLSKLAEAMRKRPQHFQVGKPFAPGALRTFVSQIDSNLEKLLTVPVSERDALTMAFHMESTIIEHKYTEIVTTDKVEYSEALAKVAAATKIHKDNLMQRLQLKKKT
jgi:hypothetical protein